MSASDARLREAMEVLAGPSKQVLDQTLGGSCVPWLGSGISRERFPSVPALIGKLLESLYDRATKTDPACPYMQAIANVVGLVPRPGVDVKSDPRTWEASAFKNLIEALTDKYAVILGMSVPVAGHPVSVRWEILDLVAIYSDTSVTPDAEHYLIGVLIAEGIWKELVTTNWDPLIEVADSETCSNGNSLHSIACNDELDVTEAPNAPRLYKIHGCARKTAGDKPKYQPFMIATEAELTLWTTDQQFRPVREALSTMLRERPVLFIGLSGQDFNLKVEVTTATLGRHPFDTTVPRVAFGTPYLTHHHRTILTSFYLEEGYGMAQAAIEAMALVPLYGKPLLGGLYMHALFAKAEAILDAGDEQLRPASISWIKSALPVIRSELESFYDGLPTTPTEMWLRFAEETPEIVSWFTSLFWHQRPLPSPRTYVPLVSGNTRSIREDASVTQLNLQWLLWSICLLIEGGRRGFWRLDIEPSSTGKPSPIAMVRGSRTRPVVIASDSRQGAAKLVTNDVITTAVEQDAIIIYPHQQRPTSVARGPRRTLTVRGTSKELAEVWLGDIYDESATDDEALEYLRLEVA